MTRQFHRPARLDPEAAESIEGAIDTAASSELAHQAAQALFGDSPLADDGPGAGDPGEWITRPGVVAVVAHPGNAHAAIRAGLCALGAGATGLLLALAPSGLGLGDVKLCTVIGLWLGWYGVLPLTLGLCAGVALGGLAAIFLLITRRAGRKDPMAYGPHLIAGALMSWPLAAA